MRRWAVPVAVVALSLLISFGFVIVYTAYAQQQADRRWCRTLTALDSPEEPATTPRGQVLQREMRKLHHDFGCEAR